MAGLPVRQSQRQGFRLARFIRANRRCGRGFLLRSKGRRADGDRKNASDCKCQNAHDVYSPVDNVIAPTPVRPKERSCQPDRDQLRTGSTRLLPGCSSHGDGPNLSLAPLSPSASPEATALSSRPVAAVVGCQAGTPRIFAPRAVRRGTLENEPPFSPTTPGLVCCNGFKSAGKACWFDNGQRLVRRQQPT